VQLGSRQSQKVQFSANSIPLPKWIFPSKSGKLKRVPGKSELLPRFRQFTPSSPTLSIRIIVCLAFHFRLHGARKLPYTWHPHLHRPQNQLEARPGLVFYKMGGSARNWVWTPLLLWVSKYVYLCLCKSKSAPVICCVPSVLLP
jgi:hypothetical protein